MKVAHLEYRPSIAPRGTTNLTERDRVTSVASESAVLVGVMLPENAETFDQLDELRGLAEAAGTSVVGKLTQRRETPNPKSYLGSGKVEELVHLAKVTDSDVVIFDNDLSPGQVRSLEQATGVKVLDRTELILDIFASHAQTYESRLAVELAQLEYSLPRLKRMWTHLSRLKMGVGMRGPGEKQLEVDRRLVEKRIHDLKTDLEKIEKRKERQVAARSDHMTVSLVGYTNAGKSTLMNRLTDANVMAKDQLFATLDTRTRRWQLPNWGPVLLSDTVGFIRDLPHRLVTSFKATLEARITPGTTLIVRPAWLPPVASGSTQSARTSSCRSGRSPWRNLRKRRLIFESVKVRLRVYYFSLLLLCGRFCFLRVHRRTLVSRTIALRDPFAIW